MGPSRTPEAAGRLTTRLKASNAVDIKANYAKQSIPLQYVCVPHFVHAYVYVSAHECEEDLVIQFLIIITAS